MLATGVASILLAYRARRAGRRALFKWAALLAAISLTMKTVRVYSSGFWRHPPDCHYPINAPLPTHAEHGSVVYHFLTELFTASGIIAGVCLIISLLLIGTCELFKMVLLRARRFGQSRWCDAQSPKEGPE